MLELLIKMTKLSGADTGLLSFLHSLHYCFEAVYFRPETPVYGNS